MERSWPLKLKRVAVVCVALAVEVYGTAIYAGDAPPVVLDRNLGDRVEGGGVQLFFTTLSGDPPISWGNLMVSGPGAAIAPTLMPNGYFSWYTADSPPGLYNFDVTATNPFGSDVGRLSVNLVPRLSPVFFVSNQVANAATALLDLTVAPNSTGMLHIRVDTEVGLQGVSLDLVETGGAIQFTGLEVYNPGPVARWGVIDGPQEVTNSAVNYIGGAALPASGTGIGPTTLAGPKVLLASVTYMALETPGVKSELSLRVGRNVIAEFTGDYARVRFGSESASRIRGDQIGASGIVGSITIVPEPARAVLAVLGVIVGISVPGRERRSKRNGCPR